VKLAIHKKTKQQVAAKVMDLLEWNKEYKNEISVLQKLHHGSIINLVDTERCLDGRGVIYLEYLPDPTLSSYIQNISTLSETLAVKIIYNLADAVHYLHSLGISHHDIKPENILYNCDNNTIKLFDFGLAVTVDPLCPTSNCNGGSPLYMAPEVLMKQVHNVFLSDIWAIGIVLYEMLIGKSPFQTCENITDLQKEWQDQRDISLPYLLCSFKLRMIYSQMVKYDPEKRISLIDTKKMLFPLLTKKCLGTSLGGSNGKQKTVRTSSVNAAIRRINPKSRKVKQSEIEKNTSQIS